MSLIDEEDNIPQEFEMVDIKLPIHIGPVFPCEFCKTNFINLDFLSNHSKKCIEKNFHSINKIQLEKILQTGKKRKNSKSNENTKENVGGAKNVFPQILIVKSDFKERRYVSRKSHQLKPSSEKPFQCKLCLKQFGVKSHLTSHFRIHTGEKPYKCKFCFKQFSDNSNLTRHLRTHTGERPFKCETCNNHFSAKATLIKHIRTHTGEKPFKCEICERQFSTESSLARHIRTHANDKFIPNKSLF